MKAHDELIWRVLTDAATKDEIAELAGLLEADPELEAEFAERAGLLRGLASLADPKNGARPPPPPQAVTGGKATKWNRFGRRALLPIIALVLASVFAIFIFRPFDPASAGMTWSPVHISDDMLRGGDVPPPTPEEIEKACTVFQARVEAALVENGLADGATGSIAVELFPKGRILAEVTVEQGSKVASIKNYVPSLGSFANDEAAWAGEIVNQLNKKGELNQTPQGNSPLKNGAAEVFTLVQPVAASTSPQLALSPEWSIDSPADLTEALAQSAACKLARSWDTGLKVQEWVMEAFEHQVGTNTPQWLILESNHAEFLYETGQWDETISLLELVLPRAAAREDINTYTRSKMHFQLGDSLYHLGDHQQALPQYEKALKFAKRPPSPAGWLMELHLFHARCLREMKRWGQGLREVEAAIKVADKHEETFGAFWPNECRNQRGMFLHKLKRGKEALASADEVLARTEGIPDCTQIRVDSFLLRGSVHWEMKTFAEAEKAFLEALNEVRGSQVPLDPLLLPIALDGLGKAQMGLGQFGRASDGFEKAFEQHTEHAPADVKTLQAILFRWAESLNQSNRPLRAIGVVERVSRLALEQNAWDQLDKAEISRLRIHGFHLLGDVKRTREEIDQFMLLPVKDDNTPTWAAKLRKAVFVANTYKGIQDLESARKIYEAGLIKLKRMPPRPKGPKGDSQDKDPWMHEPAKLRAACHWGLSEICIQTQSLRMAESHLEEALEANSTVEDNHLVSKQRRLAHNRMMLGWLAHVRGDEAKAEEHLGELRGSLHQYLDHVQFLTSWRTIEKSGQLGNQLSFVDFLSKGLAERLEEESFRLLRGYINAARESTLIDIGKTTDDKAFQQLLELQEKYKESPQKIIATHTHLAFLYLKTGKYDLAELHVEKCLGQKEEKGRLSSPDLIRTGLLAAGIYRAQGKHKTAVEVTWAMATLAEKLADPKLVMLCSYTMGELAIDQKLFGPAYRFFMDYLTVLSMHKDPEAPLATWGAFGNLAKIHEAQNHVAASIFWGKCAVNAFQRDRSGLGGLDPALQLNYLRQRDVYRLLAGQLLKAGRILEAERVLGLLKLQEFKEYLYGNENPGAGEHLAFSGKEKEWRRALDECQVRWNKGEEIDTRPGMSGFPDGTADELAPPQPDSSYAAEQSQRLKIMKQLSAPNQLVQYLLHGNTLHILLSTPEKETRHFKQAVDPDALRQKVSDFRKALQDIAVDPRSNGEKLYQTLFKPLESHLNPEGVIMVSFDDFLRYIPMAALHNGREFLVERFAITRYQDWYRNNLRSRRQADWRILGLGATRGGKDLKELPYVTRELDSIIRVKEGDASGSFPGEIRLDQQFSREAFSKMLREPTYPVIHIASHFECLPGNYYQSYLLLGSGNPYTMSDFTESEAALQKVDLLVLSACDTAIGAQAKTGNGVEFENFAALAQLKGAKGVLATLWAD